MEELLADGCYCTFLAKHNDSFLVEMSFGDSNTSLYDTLINAGVAKSSRRSSHASSHGTLSNQLALYGSTCSVVTL